MVEWTLARKKAFIIAVLRNGSRRWPPKYETLNEAKTEKKVNENTGRIAQHFKCKKCKKDFPQKMVEVDHIKPIVGIHGFTTWDAFIQALFCDKDNLQVLCKPCHLVKTKKEKTVQA
mgnify:FL=1